MTYDIFCKMYKANQQSAKVALLKGNQFAFGDDVLQSLEAGEWSAGLPEELAKAVEWLLDGGNSAGKTMAMQVAVGRIPELAGKAKAVIAALLLEAVKAIQNARFVEGLGLDLGDNSFAVESSVDFAKYMEKLGGPTDVPAPVLNQVLEAWYELGDSQQVHRSSEYQGALALSLWQVAKVAAACLGLERGRNGEEWEEFGADLKKLASSRST